MCAAHSGGQQLRGGHERGGLWLQLWLNRPVLAWEETRVPGAWPPPAEGQSGQEGRGAGLSVALLAVK